MADSLNHLNGVDGLGWGTLFSMLLVGTVLGYLALGELCKNARKRQSRDGYQIKLCGVDALPW